MYIPIKLVENWIWINAYFVSKLAMKGYKVVQNGKIYHQRHQFSKILNVKKFGKMVKKNRLGILLFSWTKRSKFISLSGMVCSKRAKVVKRTNQAKMFYWLMIFTFGVITITSLARKAQRINDNGVGMQLNEVLAPEELF